MPHPKTQKRMRSSLQHKMERLERELQEHFCGRSRRLAIQKDNTRQTRIREQIPRPEGRADRLQGGFSLTEVMGITKDEMNLVRESVRSSLHANLRGSFKNGTVKYNSIDLEVLGLIRNDIVKEHPWIKSNYEGTWPIQALIKTAIENRKRVIRRNGRKKGNTIPLPADNL
ncbi:uncharacterized protein EI90DRAFT_3142557 [Cantharellus anzutake]|uniref:uncharacterized protein n=1 Tax=Cantharellus anzutake TaxID=1750568 RepID=UPI001903A5C4|nr:uncharacterized protein EI90DRAFT_3142557 [Cantharellus anzutake]KAF8306862.1 hypothetical protein EI90DRAFT_3142557 [Cantharellus anzutake]